MIIVYSMKQDTKWGMGQALSCDLTTRAERHFSHFLTFRVLGQKPKKSSLTPLKTSSTRTTMGLWIWWSLPSTTSLSCDNKMKNQTHSFQPLLSPAPFWRLRDSAGLDAACSVPACHHAQERASADMASVLLLQPLAVWLWHLTFWICWKSHSRTHSEAKGRKAKGPLISIVQWCTAPCTRGVIVTWMESELLAWRKALAQGTRFQRRSQPSLTQPPAFLARCTLQRLERTKQQQNYFHWGAVTQAACSGQGLLTSGLGTPNDSLLLHGWSCPSPGHAAPSGSPAKATEPQESWPQAGCWGGQQGWGRVCPLPNHPLAVGGSTTSLLYSCRAGEERSWEIMLSRNPGRDRLGVIQQHTHSVPGLWNAPLITRRGSRCKCDPCAMRE